MSKDFNDRLIDNNLIIEFRIREIRQLCDFFDQMIANSQRKLFMKNCIKNTEFIWLQSKNRAEACIYINILVFSLGL